MIVDICLCEIRSIFRAYHIFTMEVHVDPSELWFCPVIYHAVVKEVVEYFRRRFTCMRMYKRILYVGNFRLTSRSAKIFM